MSVLGRIRNQAAKAAEMARQAAAAARRAAERARQAAARAAAEAQKKAAEQAAAAAKKAAEARNRDVFEGVKDKAGDFAHRLQGAAKSTVHRANDVRENVVDKVKDTAAATVSRANDVRENVVNRANDVRENVVDKVKDGAGALHDAAKVGVKVQQAAVKAGLDRANEGWQRVGDGVRANVERGVNVVDRGLDVLDAVTPNRMDGVIDAAQKGLGVSRVGLKVADKVQEAVGSAGVGLVSGVNNAAGNAAMDPVGTGKKVAREVNESVNLLQVEDRLRELGKDDTYELSASVDGSFMTAAARLSGTQKVSRNEDGSYTLSVNGQAGAGIMSRMGATGAGTAEASAFVNAGATVEFKFDDARQAADAARMFMGPQAGAVSGLVDGGVRGAVEGATPNPEIFRNNLRAVEFNAGLSAEISGQLGLAGKDSGIGLNAKASGSANATARIEFGEGKPPQIVMKQSLSVDASAGGAIPGLSGGANGSGKVEVEQRFSLPEGMDPLQVARDPKGSAQRIAQSAVDTGELTVTLSGSAAASAKFAGGNTLGGAGGANGQVDASIKLTGNAKEILATGGLQTALEGDFGGALNRLAPVVTAEAKVHTSTRRELGFDVQAGDGVNSVGVGFNGKVTDNQAPFLSYKGSVQDVQRELARALS